VGFGVVVGWELVHAGFEEEGVGFGHGGEGFGVACRAIVEDALDEDGGEAEAAIGGVDDEAGDGADVLVDETLAVSGGEIREVEGAIAGGTIQTGIRQDGDGDGNGRRGAADQRR